MARRHSRRFLNDWLGAVKGGEGIEWTDTGLAAFAKAVENLDETRIKIGVVGDKATQPCVHDPRLNVGELAQMLEYGTVTIEARPVVNGVISPQQALAESARVGQAVAEGRDPEDRLKDAGEKFATQLRMRILANSQVVGNQDSTIRRKGFNHPLLDTGQLVRSIDYELTHDDAEGEGANLEGKAKE
jgi:hypothetical protein